MAGHAPGMLGALHNWLFRRTEVYRSRGLEILHRGLRGEILY